jgi:hypothetical protein
VTTFTQKLKLSAACLVLLATTVFCREIEFSSAHPQRPLRFGGAVTGPTAKRSDTEDTQRLETADDRNTTRPFNMLYGDGSRVDLVLVSGCANDVNVQNLLTASNTEEVDEMTDAKCGIPMENLLRRIITSFPAAQVIVTGYYPSFSEGTRSDFIVKALARSFFKSHREGTQKMTSEAALDRIKINSKRWYQASNKTLAEAVRKMNTEVGATSERVMFAKIDFPPDYSFNFICEIGVIWG